MKKSHMESLAWISMLGRDSRPRTLRFTASHTASPAFVIFRPFQHCPRAQVTFLPPRKDTSCLHCLKLECRLHPKTDWHRCAASPMTQETPQGGNGESKVVAPRGSEVRIENAGGSHTYHGGSRALPCASVGTAAAISPLIDSPVQRSPAFPLWMATSARRRDSSQTLAHAPVVPAPGGPAAWSGISLAAAPAAMIHGVPMMDGGLRVCKGAVGQTECCESLVSSTAPCDSGARE